MKSLKKISAFALLFVAFGLTSCSDVEPLDPAVVVNPDPSNPTNPNPTNPGTSTGDYWPAAINNSWTFKDEGVLQPPIKIVSTDVIGGNSYSTFNQAFGSAGDMAGNATTRMRKSGGSYYYKIEDIVVGGQGSPITINMTGFETIILKDNIGVGESWNGSYSQTVTYSDPLFPTVTTNTTYVSTIMGKDLTMEIQGETFTNIIKVKMVQTSNFEGTDTVTTTYYYFAKDVGPVKYTFDEDGEITDAELVTYTLN